MFAGSEVRLAIVDTMIREAFLPMTEEIEEAEWLWADRPGFTKKTSPWHWEWSGRRSLRDCRYNPGDDWFENIARRAVEDQNDDMRVTYAEKVLGEYVEGDPVITQERADALWEQHTGPPDQDPAQLWLPGIEPLQTWERAECQEAWKFEDEWWEAVEQQVYVNIEVHYEEGSDCVRFMLDMSGGNGWVNCWEHAVPLCRLRPRTARAAAKLIGRMIHVAAWL